MAEDEDEDIEEEEVDEEIEEKIPEIEIPADYYSREMDLIKQNPRKYICDWMETNLLFVGRRAYKLICLMPCSLVIPSIPFGSTGIRANINTFLLGSPACGKTTLVKKFGVFSFNPIVQKSVSAKKLLDKIIERKGIFSLGIDDFSNILDQPDGYETVKILEGALGDEKFASHENMRYSKRANTQAVGIIGGTWADIQRYANYFRGGLLSRMSLLFLSINNTQREAIADFINRKVGDTTDSKDVLMKEIIIRDYYKGIVAIQSRNEEDFKKISNIKIDTIRGYHFDDNLKGIALQTWKNKTKEYANNINGDFKRELHDFYRFLISHAFLNIFNRKVVDGILYPEKSDYEFALKLMEETLLNKISLIQCNILINNIKTPDQLLQTLSNPRLKEDTKNILLNLSPFGDIISSSMNKPQEIKQNGI